jgi:hypothetical protein
VSVTTSGTWVEHLGNVTHPEENLAAADLRLTTEDLSHLDATRL